MKILENSLLVNHKKNLTLRYRTKVKQNFKFLIKTITGRGGILTRNDNCNNFQPKQFQLHRKDHA